MKNPISKRYLAFQKDWLGNDDYYRELMLEAVSQVRNKLSLKPSLIRQEMRKRSIKGAKEYGDKSFLTTDLEESIFEEVIDILNYTMMIEFLRRDGESRK